MNRRLEFIQQSDRPDHWRECECWWLAGGYTPVVSRIGRISPVRIQFIVNDKIRTSLYLPYIYKTRRMRLSNRCIACLFSFFNVWVCVIEMWMFGSQNARQLESEFDRLLMQGFKTRMRNWFVRAIRGSCECWNEKELIDGRRRWILRTLNKITCWFNKHQTDPSLAIKHFYFFHIITFHCTVGYGVIYLQRPEKLTIFGIFLFLGVKVWNKKIYMDISYWILKKMKTIECF